MQASQLLLLLLLQTVTAQISINFSLDNLAAVAGGLGEAATDKLLFNLLHSIVVCLLLGVLSFLGLTALARQNRRLGRAKSYEVDATCTSRHSYTA